MTGAVTGVDVALLVTGVALERTEVEGLTGPQILMGSQQRIWLYTLAEITELQDQ